MRLLAKTLLLSSLLLPTHLLADDLSQGSDVSDVSIVSRYISFYGTYGVSNNYELSGTKNDKNMDTTKMKYESGLGGGFALGFWPSSNMAVELSLKYLDRLDKVDEVETKAALISVGSVPLLAGHVEKLAINSWKLGLAGKYYLGSIMSGGDSVMGPWRAREDNDCGCFPVAFYLEFGASASYVNKEVKGDLVLLQLSQGESRDTARDRERGASFGESDKTNLKKFNKSEFVLALQGGAGIDLVLSESVLSIGYQVDYSAGDQKFKQKIENVEYEFVSDKNIVHNFDLAVKLAF